MKYKITNWENDMLDIPEQMVTKFVDEKYSNYELELLSGLKHRDIQDIYKSLKESRVIIMQPSSLDEQQVKMMVKSISHPIHVNFNGSTREWDLREFIFLSSNPFEDLKSIKEFCGGVKDGFDTGDALCKIVRSVEVHFYGFDGEHYELKNGGYNAYDIYAIRHS